MKIAMVFGKGLDGCGVQRGGAEMQAWALANGIEFDIYTMVERAFVRARGHQMPMEPIKFLPTECFEVGKRLNRDYDIVILNSYPSSKHLHASSISFYDGIVRAIERPILVGMMHEIKQMNIDCNPLVIPIMNACDVVFNFSEKTWFSRQLAEVLPSKKLGERTRRFRLWCDVDSIRGPIGNDRLKAMSFIGRWTTMKDPNRVIRLHPFMKARDPDFRLLIHGVEKSVGAATDVVRVPNNTYHTYFSDNYDFSDGNVQTYGPHTREQGLSVMRRMMFSCSFFNLPKEPENYGDRMEYTQIEMCASGTVPVFDRHFGEHNIDSAGRRYIDHDRLAVWSDRSDLAGTAEQLVDLSSSPERRAEYAEYGFDFVKREFSNDVVLPEMIATIAAVGKDVNKFTDKDLMSYFFQSDDAYPEFMKLMGSGVAPAIGFKQFENKCLCRLEGKGRITVRDFSRQPTPTASSLDSLF